MGLWKRLFSKNNSKKRSRDIDQATNNRATEVKKKKITVHELRVGMKVVELDRPWVDVPTYFQDITIRNSRDIQLLQKYCDYVYVDRETLRAVDTPKASIETQYKNRPVIYKPTSVRPRKAVKELKKELPRAKKTFDSSKKHIHATLKSIQKDGHINVEESRKTVTECVTSILSNPNAMFWMTKIKDQDEYTAEHCLRVGILAITFGRHLQLAQPDLELLGLCGMLHDAGKMKVPNTILDKPAALTKEEFDIIKEHTTLGYVFLKEHGGIPEAVCNAAYNHHEALDKTGYPRQLEPSLLTAFDRIIAIVDSYDAMTSDRCYRKGMTPFAATSILYKQSQKRYDEYLVKEFIRMVGIYPVGSFVELNNGFYAIIISANEDHKLEPIVEIIADPNKIPLTRKVAVDLSKKKKYKGVELAITKGVSDSDINVQMQSFIDSHF